MKRSRSLDLRLKSRWLESNIDRARPRRVASAAGMATLGALSIGAGAGPGDALAALVTIDGTQQFTQRMGNGDSLEITVDGSIQVPEESGVIPLGTNDRIGFIANDGIINAGRSGILIDQGATLTGGITNTGSINSARAEGISLSGFNGFTGDIVNAGGAISAGGSGVKVDGRGSSNPIIDGDISNAGNAGNAGTITATGKGIHISRGVTLQGDIINAEGGVIVTATRSGSSAIDVTDSEIAGSIVNDGTIDTGDDGITLSQTQIGGGIVNRGRIDASSGTGILVSSSSSVAAGITNAGGGIIEAERDAIRLEYVSTIAGPINNAGTITAGRDGVLISDLSEVGSSITNTGTITADRYGVAIARGATLNGSIVNSGTIAAENDAIAVFRSATLQGGLIGGAAAGTASAIAEAAASEGGITNTGTVTAGDNGILVSNSATLTGGITNTGSVAAEASIVVTTSSRVDGEIVNTGTLDGRLAILGAAGSAGSAGIDVINTGLVDIGSSQSSISGSFTQPSGTLAIDLLSFGEYRAPPLTIAGDAVIGGELLLGFDPTFSLTEPTRFTMMQIAGALAGVFGNYEDEALVRRFGPYALRIDYDYDNGSVALYSEAPAPPTLALIGLGLFGWRVTARRNRS